MNPETALLIAAASGIFALIGSLGSQLINALANLRAKRMELVYVRKLDAYKELIEKATGLADEVDSDDKFSEFYRAILATTTIASQNVFVVIADTKEGILHIARRAHSSTTDRTKNLNLYNDAINRLAFAMRKDLKKFSGG